MKTSKIETLEPGSVAVLDGGSSHRIGTVVIYRDEATLKITRATVFSRTQQTWIKLHIEENGS